LSSKIRQAPRCVSFERSIGASQRRADHQTVRDGELHLHVKKIIARDQGDTVSSASTPNCVEGLAARINKFRPSTVTMP
jgi:hypothetical protein